MVDRELFKSSLDRDFQSIASKYRPSDQIGGVDSSITKSIYDGLRGSEKSIRSEIDRAHTSQDDRIQREIKTNTYLRQDYNDLKTTLGSIKTTTAVDYLEKDRVKYKQLERENDISRKIGASAYPDYDADAIKRRHHDREREIFSGSPSRAGRLSPARGARLSPSRYSPSRTYDRSPENKSRVKVGQGLREDEIYENLYRKAQNEYDYENRLKESIQSNKTFELSQSLRSSMAVANNRVNGGLRSLEEKIDRMERELDTQLAHNGKVYFTNKELVKATQHDRERILARQHEVDDAIDSKKNLFQEAFAKREEQLARENVEFAVREKSAELRHTASSFKGDDLSQLELENVKIRQELQEMRKKSDVERNPHLYPEHPSPRTHKPELPKKKSAAILQSDQGFNDLIREDDIRKTALNARKKVHQKLEANEQKKAAQNKVKIEYPTISKYQSLKRQTYQKYYGTSPHLNEAAFLLSKGLPTTLCSDTNVEPKIKDPKTMFPKKFDRVLKK